MADYREVVIGRIVAESTGDPVAEAEVTAFDKDLLLNDNLGTTKTAADGTFRIEFGWEDFKKGVFEDRPDIFVTVVNPLSGKKTKTPVSEELSGELSEDDKYETMDLGDIKIS